MALVKGDVTTPDPVLVRVHAVDMLEDLLGMGESGRGDQLHRAMEVVGAAGRGVIIILREPAPDAIGHRVRATLGYHPARPRDLRVYGIGAQILHDLGVKDMILLSNAGRQIVGLEGYGLSVVETARSRREKADGGRRGGPRAAAPPGARVLVVEARYYAGINAMLLAGAVAALERAGAVVEHTVVPGALEIPTAVALAHRSGRFDAYVALGCVIRGETSHYDLVAGESCRGLTDLGVREGLPIGNGILTVENERQAEVRADPNGQDKGGGAALAALICWRSSAASTGNLMAPARAKPTLNRRRAARLAAVQALYQVEVTGERPEKVAGEFTEHRLASLLEPVDPETPSPEVDREWFRMVVVGAWGARERIDLEIERCLAPGWTLARCGFLLRATLRAGAYELAERTDVPVKVVINEYVELAHLFFTDTEPGFVNAVLDKLAPRLRAVETGL